VINTVKTFLKTAPWIHLSLPKDSIQRINRVHGLPLAAGDAQNAGAWKDVGRLYRMSVHCHGAPRSPRSIHRHLRMTLRSLLTAPRSFQWFAFLEQHPVANAFLQSNPRLAEKAYRDYLRNSLGPRQRVETLQAHYRIMQQRFHRHVWQNLARSQSERMCLAELKGRAGEIFTIDLLQTPFPKEGELALQFFDVALNMALTTMTFTLCGSPENPIIHIGGLQGIRGKTSPEPIRRATRALQGLRPKHAVLLSLCELGKWLGADHMVAIGLQNHIYCKKGRKPKKIKADYEAFWIEQNGQRLPEGDFLIPNSRRIRPIEETASNKRAEYRRRNALIEQMQQQVLDSIGK
jgi:uncharacterized protein VirK/YbjX